MRNFTGYFFQRGFFSVYVDGKLAGRRPTVEQAKELLDYKKEAKQ